MNRKQALKYVENIENLEALKTLLVDCVANGNPGKKGTWSFHADKLLNWLENGMRDSPPFSIFRKNGNKKLPFYAFSSLAFADCPGKGACMKYCYSLKAWRYPAAFFRQVQNSLLVRFKWEAIDKAWKTIPQGKTVRLFVDGDFPTVGIIKAFMELIKARTDLTVYGYTKSWKEFVSLHSSGYVFPGNYVLNQSNGSKWENTGIANAFANLPILRGKFDAVEVAKHFIKSKAYQDKSNPGSDLYRKAVREKLKAITNKVFACPGNCGNCLPNGRHACGSKEFTGVTIGIGIHA
jgi:hypothetical protein